MMFSLCRRQQSGCPRLSCSTYAVPSLNMSTRYYCNSVTGRMSATCTPSNSIFLQLCNMRCSPSPVAFSSLIVPALSCPLNCSNLSYFVTRCSCSHTLDITSGLGQKIQCGMCGFAYTPPRLTVRPCHTRKSSTTYARPET